MFPTGLVAADHTRDLLTVLVLVPGALVVRALLADVTGRDGRHRGPEAGRHGARLAGAEAAPIEGVVQGQRGHGHRGDGGRGRGQEAGVPPYRGGGRHEGHVGHQGDGGGGQQAGERTEGADGGDGGVENVGHLANSHDTEVRFFCFLSQTRVTRVTGRDTETLGSEGRGFPDLVGSHLNKTSHLTLAGPWLDLAHCGARCQLPGMESQ